MTNDDSKKPKIFLVGSDRADLFDAVIRATVANSHKIEVVTPRMQPDMNSDLDLASALFLSSFAGIPYGLRKPVRSRRNEHTRTTRQGNKKRARNKKNKAARRSRKTNAKS